MQRSIYLTATILFCFTQLSCDSRDDSDLAIRVRGTVTELPSGDSVEDVQVELLYATFSSERRYATTQTDADGRYVLEASVLRRECGITLFLTFTHPDPFRRFGGEQINLACVEEEQVIDVAFRDPADAGP